MQNNTTQTRKKKRDRALSGRYCAARPKIVRDFVHSPPQGWEIHKRFCVRFTKLTEQWRFHFQFWLSLSLFTCEMSLLTMQVKF